LGCELVRNTAYRGAFRQPGMLCFYCVWDHRQACSSRLHWLGERAWQLVLSLMLLWFFYSMLIKNCKYRSGSRRCTEVEPRFTGEKAAGCRMRAAVGIM